MPKSAPIEYVLAEMRARELRAAHDFAAAAASAREASRLAEEAGDSTSAWHMRFFEGDCLVEAGQRGLCLPLVQALIDSPVASAEPGLLARALVLAAKCLQSTGRLAEAVEAATRSVGILQFGRSDGALLLQARQALVAALAESGELGSAWDHCVAMKDEITADMNQQDVGRAYWTIGNVAFLNDRPDVGVDFHERATDTFSPGRDLDLWAKFNKASAAMRLAAGIADAGTLQCLQRAELAMEIAGGSVQDHLLLDIARANWNLLAGHAQSAVDLLAPICDSGGGSIAAQTAAEATALLARALKQLGQHGEAQERLESAARLFRGAGAQERARQLEEA